MRGSSLDGYRDLPWLQPLLPQQWLSLWPLPLPLLPLLQPLLSPPLSLLPLPSLFFGLSRAAAQVSPGPPPPAGHTAAH